MTTLTKTVAVSAICNGTVIDHIPAGQALSIIKFLKLTGHNRQVTLGLNLPSSHLGYKDLIKVEERTLSSEETSQVAILAPEATVNLIENFSVKNKFKVTLPKRIEGVISCPNPRCISNHETAVSKISVLQRWRGNIRLQCHYCRKTFSQEEIS